MNKEETISCKIEKLENGYRYKCGENEGVCLIYNKGITGGVNILGSGLNAGKNEPTLFCVDENDLKQKLEEKYNKNVVFKKC